MNVWMDDALSGEIQIVVLGCVGLHLIRLLSKTLFRSVPLISSDCQLPSFPSYYFFFPFPFPRNTFPTILSLPEKSVVASTMSSHTILSQTQPSSPLPSTPPDVSTTSQRKHSSFFFLPPFHFFFYCPNADLNISPSCFCKMPRRPSTPHANRNIVEC